jgi:hypothetical protein
VQVAQAVQNAAATPKKEAAKQTKAELAKRELAKIELGANEPEPVPFEAVESLVTGFRKMAELVGPDTPEEEGSLEAALARVETVVLQRDFATSRLGVALQSLLSALATVMPETRPLIEAMVRHPCMRELLDADVTRPVPAPLTELVKAAKAELQKGGASGSALQKSKAGDEEMCARCGREGHKAEVCYAGTMAGTGVRIKTPMTTTAEELKQRAREDRYRAGPRTAQRTSRTPSPQPYRHRRASPSRGAKDTSRRRGDSPRRTQAPRERSYERRDYGSQKKVKLQDMRKR